MTETVTLELPESVVAEAVSAMNGERLRDIEEGRSHCADGVERAAAVICRQMVERGYDYENLGGDDVFDIEPPREMRKMLRA